MRHFALLSLLACFFAITAIFPCAALESPQEKLAIAEQEKQAEKIGRQLRCPVCQNANIEESNAPLAKTLRTVIRQQVAAGKSEKDILTWMQARYGDFIFLTPPLSRYSLLLWLTPCVAVLGGLLLLLLRYGAKKTEEAE